MKKALLGTAIALTVSSLAMPAGASDGTINIRGKLTQATCTVKIDGGSADALITLPSLSTSTLSKSGATAGRTAFTINLTGCTTSFQNPAENITKVRAYFEHGPNVDPASGRLNNSIASTAGGAGNVQVQLRDEAENEIYIGNTSQRANAAETLTSQGAADLVYNLYYYATGQSTPGSLATSVTYSIDYE